MSAAGSEPTAVLPGALDEPTVPVRRGYIAAVVLANLGIMLAFYFACESSFLEDIGTDSGKIGGYMVIGQVAESAQVNRRSTPANGAAKNRAVFHAAAQSCR